MKKTSLDDLINAIADNHGAPARAETAAAKTALRKKKHEDEDDAPRVEDEMPEEPAAAGAAPLQLAQAGTGVATDAAPNGASGAAAGETAAGAAAEAAAGEAAGGIGLGGLLLGGLALAAAGGGGGGAVAAAIDNVVSGTLVAGPVVAGHGLKVEIYAANGTTKLGESTLAANGTFTVNIGSYTGIVIARVVDTNGDDPDYLDEATGAAKDLNANLMAVSVVSGGAATLNINPLTTIAAQKAGLAADGSGSLADGTAVTNANAAVANAFGLTDLTSGTVVPTNGGDYVPAGGLSEGERYGAILAALSGADQNNGGDSQTTINALAAKISVNGSTGTLSGSGQTLVLDGAAAAAGKVAGDAVRDVFVAIAGADDSRSDTTSPDAPAINLVATDDIINAGEQTAAITGTAEANALVKLTLGGSNTRNVVADGSGNWTYTPIAADIAAMGQGAETLGATATDAAGNTSSAGTRDINVDTVAPTVAITDDETGTGNIAGGDITYTFNFSEAVTGFTAADVTVANGSKGAFTAVSGSEYTLFVTPTAGFEGDVTVGVAGAAAQDIAGNDSTAAAQSVQAVDTKAPTVVITDDETGTGNIAGGNITYTFNFSEAVTGFTADDITVANGAKGTFTTVSATEYSLVVTPTTGLEGDVTVDVATAAAQDAAGNDNTAAAQSVQPVDMLAPVFSGATVSGSTPVLTYGVTDQAAPRAIDPLAPSLSVVASAGAEANQIKLTVTTSALPAGVSTAALSFTGLPAGASVRNGASEEVTAGVAGFSGSGIFTVTLPEASDISQALWLTVTGKDAGGTETGHNVQAIDLTYDASSSTELLSFSSRNQSMWGDIDSYIGWHEYIPLLGAAPIVWNPQTEEWDDVADGDFAAARETANAAARAAVDAAKVVFDATAFAVDPAVQAVFDAAKLNFDTKVNSQTLAQLSAAQATYDQATTSYQQGINTFAAAKAEHDAAETVWNGQVAWYSSLNPFDQFMLSAINVQNEAIWNGAQTSYSQAQAVMATTQGVFDAATAAYDADTLAAEFAQATAAFNAAEATFNAAKQATYDSALTIYEAAQQAAWGSVGQAADDNGYWHSGKFSVIDIDLDSAQILDTVSAAANTVLDAAKTVFDATKDVIDQGLNTAVAAARGVLELAEDALYGAARTVDQGVRDTFLLAKNTYAAAKVVYDQASYAFNTIATGLHTAADQAWAKALSDWNSLSDWDKFWWGNAAKEAAWGVHVVADGLYYGVDVLGVHIPGAVEIWNGAKSFFETTATNAYNLALATYNAAAAAADQLLQDSFDAAKHTLDVAEQAVQDALEFAYNGALVIYNGVQSGVQTAINEINSKLDFDSALKVDAEVFAQVGLQVDFVLDAGSVDTDIDYQLTSTTQYNKTTDMLAIIPTMTNMTTGTSVAFDTISPNAKFYAALLYDVSADFDVFVDGKLVVDGRTIYDLSPTSDGFTLQFPLSTDMLDDVVNMADELGKASNITVPALDLSDIEIGKQVLVNFDSTALEPYEIPYIKALTQDILTLEVALPTLETAGTAATYVPATADVWTKGTFEEQWGPFPYADLDFSEIIGTFLNTLFPKFDFGEDFIANYDLESLGLPTYLELLQSIQAGQTSGADVNRTIAETVDVISKALLTAIVDVLDGHATTGAIFVVDMSDETASSLVHLNLFPDSVIGDTTSAATGSLGFYAAYGESAPLIKATMNIDGAYDLIVKSVLKIVLPLVGVPVTPGDVIDKLIDAMPTQFNNALGIETILDLVEADEATKTAVSEVVQLGYNFETVNLDISHEANVSQEFTLSIDDMSYLVTLEDGIQQTFTANGTGGLLIEHASSHDANGDGSLAYTLDIVPTAMFSNDTEIGLGYGYVLDFLKGTVNAGFTLPLDSWLGLPDWANISYSALDLDLGPLLRVQGDIDTLDVDVFESRFALDIGSASYAGAVDIALVNAGVMG